MKKAKRKSFYVSIVLFVLFLIFTAALQFVDVKVIGPQGSSVGFAELNGLFHSFTGVNMSLYSLTDLLGIVPLLTTLVFAFLGLFQWISRKSLFKVDYDILMLGIFYIVVAAVFFIFEKLALNYRPVLINGILEASYPSSTTLLVMCVMPAAAIQLNKRIENFKLKRLASGVIIAFTAFTVLCRLISGVHWISDIIGGALISGGLVLMYYYAVSTNRK